jgi:cyclase
LTSFERGLFEVGDGVHAYVQPDGSWGWSNAGLIQGEGASLLVDTLFDLRLTRQMLDEMSSLLESAPITAVANTHANGDHCFGNQLLSNPGVRFYASDAASKEMSEVSPAAMAEMMRALPDDDGGRFMAHAFSQFSFEGIDVPPITDPFTGDLTLEIGGRRIELLDVGPAHTEGDVLAWLPDERVLFAGDILFIEGTPIMWGGPLSNWIGACERICALAPAVVVPGHGPLTDVAGVKAFADYLRFVQEGVRRRHEAGMSPREASLDLDDEVNGSRFADWSDRERLAVTVHVAWSELEPGYQQPGFGEMFEMMAVDYARRNP